MAGNITFTMIKPEAVANGHTGAILAKMQAAGFRLVAMKKMKLSEDIAACIKLETVL